MTLDLPDGLLHRPLTMDDVSAVVALMAADELVTLGTVIIQESDIVADWQRPSFDLAASTVGVFDSDSHLLGYAEVSGQARGDATVHPDHRGRGIGTALAGWMQETARAQGQTEIGMAVPQGSAAETLLRALGYRMRWESWVLELPEGRAIENPVLPDGYRLRTARPEDVEPAYHVLEDAFLEWSARDKQSLADWRAQIVERPGHEPWNLQVVLTPDEQVVGVVHVTRDLDGSGFVNKVAVRADQRRQGLARALLASAFTAARDGGSARSELSTDSRTGALDLYLGLGMEITSTWVNLGISLTGGRA